MPIRSEHKRGYQVFSDNVVLLVVADRVLRPGEIVGVLSEAVLVLVLALDWGWGFEHELEHKRAQVFIKALGRFISLVSGHVQPGIFMHSDQGKRMMP
jgi:hypothetical protein